MQKNNKLKNKVWSFLFDRKELTKPDADVKPVIDKLYHLSQADEFDQDKALTLLNQKLHAENSEKQFRSIRYRKMAGYAAAVIAIAVVSTVVIRYRANPANTPKQELIITADKNAKNIQLTLSNGNVVALPDKGSAKISQNDSVLIEETKDASLSYQAQKTEKALEYNTLEIPRTMNYRLQLSDGTVVYLNSETRIRFPKAFPKSERKVFLEKGEAYFEVARNERSPFTVEVKGAEIRVLGTVFNVSAYGENATPATTLVSGKVEVLSGKETVLLNPGEQATEKDGAFSVKTVDLAPYVAWKNGLFIFKRQTLETVMMQMHRWYDFSLVFVDSEIKNYRLTGVIYKDLPEKEIFSILERTNNIKIEMDAGRVVRVRKG